MDLGRRRVGVLLGSGLAGSRCRRARARRPGRLRRRPAGAFRHAPRRGRVDHHDHDGAARPHRPGGEHAGGHDERLHPGLCVAAVRNTRHDRAGHVVRLPLGPARDAITTEPGWLDVRLAQRPNGSTIWVHQSDVTLSSTPYYIVVSLTTMHLQVFDNGALLFDFPAGIGAPDDPTPTGNYFMPMRSPSPGPGYGPFVLVTSDHSDTITDWENSGDAIIGIHGPITSYDDSLIGTTGAAISHGCIRLHDADLAQLSVIPAGTPIDVDS